MVLVLPGRVARLDAEMRMEDLTLKGIFVRFISHEIRYYCILHCTEQLCNSATSMYVCMPR